MTIRDTLIKLRLCSEITYIGENKIFDWLQQNPSCTDLTLDVIKSILNLNSKKIASFSKAYTSISLENEVITNKLHSTIVTIIDEDYPYRLKECYRPPIVLFMRGNTQLLNRQSLAVVGARQRTNYSIEVIQLLLPNSIQNDKVILSGLAAGVDTLAHQFTIANGADTIAVIGTGLNIYYPKINEELQIEISKKGLLLSEYGLNTGPQRNHFPERNRIIAGLCECLLVTEAKHHSGSLITANLALQENRTVLAVPGSIISPLSLGCNELIIAGAMPIINGEQILAEFYEN
ncbi:DNA-processing protein DprA [Dellaglioa sp. P0083]|uniref:DNA-processing protein DprA n=1 Tax=Dellaglioa kimchii TaxID=3344667 RepID=UPI0038D3808A